MFLRNFLVAATLAVLAQSQAKAEVYKINLDWNKKSTLSDGVVQMCDDTYYKAVDIFIPGTPGKDFFVTMDTTITSGKSVLGCSVKRRVKADGSGAVYTFDAINGGCSIRVEKVRSDFREEQKVATYDISDAC